jgi:hypothetical protein
MISLRSFRIAVVGVGLCATLPGLGLGAFGAWLSLTQVSAADAVPVTPEQLARVEPGTLVRLRGTVQAETVLDDEWLRDDPHRIVLKAERLVAVKNIVTVCARMSGRTCVEHEIVHRWERNIVDQPIVERSWVAVEATVAGVPFPFEDASIRGDTPPGDALPLHAEAPGHTVITPEGGCFRAGGLDVPSCIEVRSGDAKGVGDVRIGYRVLRTGIEGLLVGEWDGSRVVPRRNGPARFLALYPEMSDEEVVDHDRWQRLLSLLCVAPGVCAVGIPLLGVVVLLVASGLARAAIDGVGPEEIARFRQHLARSVRPATRRKLGR